MRADNCEVIPFTRSCSSSGAGVQAVDLFPSSILTSVKNSQLVSLFVDPLLSNLIYASSFSPELKIKSLMYSTPLGDSLLASTTCSTVVYLLFSPYFLAKTNTS